MHYICAFGSSMDARNRFNDLDAACGYGSLPPIPNMGGALFVSIALRRPNICEQLGFSGEIRDLTYDKSHRFYCGTTAGLRSEGWRCWSAFRTERHPRIVPAGGSDPLLRAWSVRGFPHYRYFSTYAGSELDDG